MNRKLVALFFAYLIIMPLIMAQSIYLHERAHQQIYRYGGVDSKIEFSPYTLTAYTVPIKTGEWLNESYSQSYILHAQNEIVGYHVLNLTYSVWIVGFFIIAFLLAITYRIMEEK